MTVNFDPSPWLLNLIEKGQVTIKSNIWVKGHFLCQLLFRHRHTHAWPMALPGRHVVNKDNGVLSTTSWPCGTACCGLS